MENGLDPQTRIPKFTQIYKDAREAYRDALNECARNPQRQTLMEPIKRTASCPPPKDTGPTNQALNRAFVQCGLSYAVQEFEKVSIAYTASIEHAWTTALALNRKTHDSLELDSMLESGLFRSINHGFVATSLTASPTLSDRRINCTIRVTDEYRRRARPLTYTSVFRCEFPETFGGLKSAGSLEDEVRIMNGTLIEEGTVDITFYYDGAPPASSMDRIRTRYANLGKVSFEPYGDASRDAAATPAGPA